MGDHRASIKIEMEFHGIKDKCDMWLNYYPQECCRMDKRVVDFFNSVYERGRAVYDQQMASMTPEERKEFAMKGVRSRKPKALKVSL